MTQLRQVCQEALASTAGSDFVTIKAGVYSPRGKTKKGEYFMGGVNCLVGGPWEDFFQNVTTSCGFYRKYEKPSVVYAFQYNISSNAYSSGGELGKLIGDKYLDQYQFLSNDPIQISDLDASGFE